MGEAFQLMYIAGDLWELLTKEIVFIAYITLFLLCLTIYWGKFHHICNDLYFPKTDQEIVTNIYLNFCWS
jgi:hypothetical protein